MEEEKLPAEQAAENAQPQPEPNEQAERTRCLNCEKKLPRKAIFCPRCGQRNNMGKASMRELFLRFWVNFSHLDAKFIKMCWQLFLPARVTLEYFRGRQKRYPNPVQFFLIVMFFFLLALNADFGRLGDAEQPDSNAPVKVSTDTAAEKTDVKINMPALYPALQQYVLGNEMLRALDSLPPDMNTPIARRTVDTLLRITNPAWAQAGQIWLRDSANAPVQGLLDTVPLSLVDFQLKIATADLVRLEPHEIADKYNVRSWRQRFFLEQGIKTFKDPKALMHNYLGSLTWSLLVLLTLMSAVLAALYWRQRRYFVEHFVFLMHQHSGAIMLFTLALICSKLTDSLWIWLPVAAFTEVHLYKALRRFYGQSRAKTFLKWLIFNVVYLLGFIVLFTLGLVVVFLLF